MQIDKSTVIIEGVVKRNIYGNWDDVTKGVFVDSDSIESILWYGFKNKNVRITIENIEG